MKITKEHWVFALFIMVMLVMPTLMIYSWKHPNYSEPDYTTISGEVVGKKEPNTLILDSYDWYVGSYFGIQVSDEDFTKYQVGDWYFYDLYVPPKPIYPKIDNMTMDS